VWRLLRAGNRVGTQLRELHMLLGLTVASLAIAVASLVIDVINFVR
jgi:hypothetical protein